MWKYNLNAHVPLVLAFNIHFAAMQIDSMKPLSMAREWVHNTKVQVLI